MLDSLEKYSLEKYSLEKYRHLFALAFAIRVLPLNLQWFKPAKYSRCTVALLMLAMNSFAQPPQVAEERLPESAIVEGLLAGKYSIVMRHALAPGTSDPKGFQLENCETQRNLSAQGRKQAEAIGEFLRRSGIKKPAVYTSQWCRCKDTARLLGFAGVAELTVINSFFKDFQQRDRQTKATMRWLLEQASRKRPSGRLPLVLVTHQVNISALTGEYPRPGEMIVVELSHKGELKVVARWFVDA